MADDQKAADAKAAQDKKDSDRIAADQKAAADERTKDPVHVSGDPVAGGPFAIYGVGLGSSGTLTIGGKDVKITSWNESRVKGTLPPNTKGDVVLSTGTGVRHGVFPSPPQVVGKRTTVTEETVPLAQVTAPQKA